ncbi:MAG: hypothetical protein ACKOF7_12575, partial [Phycisphaerales bacterium]
DPDFAHNEALARSALEQQLGQERLDPASSLWEKLETLLHPRLGLWESLAALALVLGVLRARELRLQLRWALVLGGGGAAAQVLGQAPSDRAAPELYKQFRTMQVLGRALAAARAKYVLGPGVSGRTDLDVTMKQAESGLNLSDYLERKEPASGGRTP